MMYIWNGSIEDEPIRPVEWHVGQPVPFGLSARVISFQADGDELEAILAMMRGERRENVCLDVTPNEPA